jgi:tRNA nucleotidyltransferase (CCA-adding enzyme)
MDDLRRRGEAVLERMRELPGAEELLDLAAGRDDVEIVGGAVRDLLLERAPRELDVVVASDASAFARDLASSLGIPPGAHTGGSSGIALHERFGTALVWWQGGRVDIARRRAEAYSAPGALPDVRAGTPEQDLLRRDFTVNAIAVVLGGPRMGSLSAVPHALEDLTGSRLRVLHERSFVDDPTRLLRLARYLARLGFEPEQHTAELAAQAIADGGLSGVSGARVGAELRLLLEEPDPLAALASLSELGILQALHPGLRFERQLARRALAALPGNGRPEVLLLAALLLGISGDPPADPERPMLALLDHLEFTAGDRDRVITSALAAPLLPERLEAARTPSQIGEAARGVPIEAVALARSLAEVEGRPAAAAAAARWLSDLRHVRLQITGDDLLAAGISPGPEIGRRLGLALQRKLDGELDGDRAAEMAAAMEDA